MIAASQLLRVIAIACVKPATTRPTRVARTPSRARQAGWQRLSERTPAGEGGI
jgi:hypothetical protein